MLKTCKKMNLSLLTFIFFITALVSCGGGSGSSGNNPVSSTSKQMTKFSFASPASTGIIDESAKSVSVTVPFGTDRSALKAVFTTTGVKTTVGGVEQASGTTVNNFTNPLKFRVTAEDGSYSDYTVTVKTWVKTFGSVSDDKGYSICTDSSGNVYFAGSFQGTVDFLGGEITSKGGSDIALVKYSSDGTLIWAKTFGGTGYDYGLSICIDSSDNVYVAGFFSDVVNFGGGNVISNGWSDAFIVKYSSDGTYKWADNIGGTSFAFLFSTCIDSFDNVYISGSFSGTIDFGEGDVNSNGGNDAFVVKYDTDGSFQNAITFGGTGEDSAGYVSTDASDNIYISGYFSSSVNFGGGDVVSNGGKDAFVVKYDTDGSFQNAITLGGSGDDAGGSVCTDLSDKLYVTGNFSNTVNFGGGDVASNGGKDAFVVKYSEAGIFQKAITFGGAGDDFGSSVCTDSSNNLYVTGNFSNTVNFGEGNVASNGVKDAFVVKYSEAGIFQKAITFGGTGDDIGNSVCTDSSDNLYVTGNFSNAVNLGNGNVTSNGGSDIFLINVLND